MIKKHADAIGHAMNGLKWAIKTQPNYKVHAIFTVLTLLFGLILNISYFEWLVVVIMITGGFTVETFNTAIERLGDAVDQNYNEFIKLAKDLSAASMMIYAFGSVVVATLIFIPKMVEWFHL